METTIAVAVIGFVGIVVAAIVGFLARPRIDKRNNNPGNSGQLVRDECAEIKTLMGNRFDRLEDTATTGFRAVAISLADISRILSRIEGRLSDGKRQAGG